MSSCRAELPSGSLPTSMRMASRRAYSRMAGLTRRSTTSTSADCRCCCAFSVMRSGSPGPQPISATLPTGALVRAAGGKLAVELAVGGSRRRRQARPCARRPAAGPPRCGGARPDRRWRRARGGAAPGARCATRPNWAGSQLSILALISRARIGAAPSVPMATTTGSRSTIAGMMKLLCDGPVDHVDGQAARPAQRRRRARRAQDRRWRQRPAPPRRGRPR